MRAYIIVIIILGILAALAIPQFTTSTEDAKTSTLKGSLSVFRGAINLYYHEHNSTYPGAVKIDGTGTATAAGDNPDAFTKQLTQYSARDGETSAARDPANFPYGPYLQAIPENPSNNLNTVQVVDTASPIAVGDVTGSAGWIYSKQTGEIRAHDNLTF